MGDSGNGKCGNSTKGINMSINKRVFKQMCLLGESGDGKVQNIPKDINEGQGSFQKIATMLSARNNTKGITKGKCAFWQTTEMVKCRNNIPEH